ncbi:VanZ family protein [Ruania alkalisoli]|uniref:VanZ family protein n=1 Tax=Ruania alkalisoli TaxID=2779775 RepID=A0A7M1SSA7_9MICO|nr:VanZ family protein [Ruania alkalisoli]QOR69662.1 VanZ family protein [Ruania alkalisoli]
MPDSATTPPSASRRRPGTTPSSTWLVRLAFAGSILVQLVVLYLPATPDGAPSTPGADKAVHVLVFAVVMLTGRLLPLPGVPLAAVLLVHAGVSELVQHLLLPGRSGDLADIVADIAGIALGWYVASMITRHRLRR